MMINQQHREPLTEIINTALAHTASSLSDLTDCGVLIDALRVTVSETGDLSKEISGFVGSEIAAVHQTMTGPVSGDAFLLLDHNDAVRLLELLTQEKPLTNQLNESDCEALTEVGNLLLEDCVGALGNLFEAQMIFSVPRLHLESLDRLLDQIAKGKEERRYALVVRVSFGLRDHLLSGCLVMAFGVDSLDPLMRAIERREKLQIEV